MFAHQVIEDLLESTKYSNVIKSGLDKEFLFMCEEIKQCEFFYFDNYIETSDLMKSVTGMPLFQKELSKNIRLPYKKTWFAYNLVWPQGMRVGVYLNEISPIEFSSIIFWNKNKELWRPLGLCFHIILTDIIGENNLFSKTFPKIIDFHTCAGTLLSFEQSKKDLKHISFAVLSLVNTSLLLLNCKNIETKTIKPDIKLNKKRIKNCKQPLFTYKTLVIKPIGKHQESIPKHLWENRVHLCRGHFKTYTEKNPLFGKFTGRYWWQPSVRGQNKNGMVVKDYKVEI